MAQAVGAHSSYDEASLGNREDLSNVIWDVSPTDTPGIQAIGKNKAKATNHEWLTDVLTAAASNAHIEGNDAVPVDPAARVRVTNYTQILKKHAVVTGTQQAVDKGGGIKNEMAYQMARRMKEMKRDLELAIFGVSNVKVAGNDTTAREMGSLDAYLKTNDQFAATSTTATGDGTDVSDYAGTDRDITEAILKAGLQSVWDNSGGNSNVMLLCDSGVKGTVSTFTSSSTRHVTTDDKKLVASIDVYDGDFHTVKIVPDRYCRDGSAWILDPEYLKVSQLRPISSYDLAKNGDAVRKEIVWEVTLEVCNELAHANIGDLN